MRVVDILRAVLRIPDIFTTHIVAVAVARTRAALVANYGCRDAMPE